jgi:hypothetical protein
MIFNRAITDVAYLADHLLPYVVDDVDFPAQTIEPLPDNQKFIFKTGTWTQLKSAPDS